MTARRKDTAAWDRVRLLLDAPGQRLTHAQVAARAGTTYEVVRAVRRELGQVRKTPERATPIGARLSRSRSPPAPVTTTRRPGVVGRSARRAAPVASGVWA